jgi:hypothetical protein
MTLFANTTCFSATTHLINCFILDGEKFIVDTIVNVLRSMRSKLLQFDDLFDL